jgi:hypothetical protein
MLPTVNATVFGFFFSLLVFISFCCFVTRVLVSLYLCCFCLYIVETCVTGGSFLLFDKSSSVLAVPLSQQHPFGGCCSFLAEVRKGLSDFSRYVHALSCAPFALVTDYAAIFFAFALNCRLIFYYLFIFSALYFCFSYFVGSSGLLIFYSMYTFFLFA